MLGHDLIVTDPPWDFENYSIAGPRRAPILSTAWWRLRKTVGFLTGPQVMKHMRPRLFWTSASKGGVGGTGVARAVASRDAEIQLNARAQALISLSSDLTRTMNPAVTQCLRLVCWADGGKALKRTSGLR